MDQLVLDSLKKWPNVPFCYGWLALDRRGEWRMRNEFAQQNHLPGDVIKHEALKEFIQRNFVQDQQGAFFFQNGPQRVFVTLDYTPWVARLIPNENNGWTLQTTTGQTINPIACYLDENGQILLESNLAYTKEVGANEFASSPQRSVVLLHDHDLEIFSGLASIEHNACNLTGTFDWQGIAIPIHSMMSEDIAHEFSFIAKPHA